MPQKTLILSIRCPSLKMPTLFTSSENQFQFPLHTSYTNIQRLKDRIQLSRSRWLCNLRVLAIYYCAVSVRTVISLMKYIHTYLSTLASVSLNHSMQLWARLLQKLTLMSMANSWWRVMVDSLQYKERRQMDEWGWSQCVMCRHIHTVRLE
jgi:hypothetical protein